MNPTEEMFGEVGWNTPEVGNPLLTERAQLQALSMIGVVLVQIRDALLKIEERTPAP